MIHRRRPLAFDVVESGPAGLKTGGLVKCFWKECCVFSFACWIVDLWTVTSLHAMLFPASTKQNRLAEHVTRARLGLRRADFCCLSQMPLGPSSLGKGVPVGCGGLPPRDGHRVMGVCLLQPGKCLAAPVMCPRRAVGCRSLLGDPWIPHPGFEHHEVT